MVHNLYSPLHIYLRAFLSRILLYFFFEKIYLLKHLRVLTSIKGAFVSRKVVSGKPLSKLSCVCLPLEKLVNGKHFRSTKNTFQSKKNLAWFPGKYFPFILDGKHFLEVVKNLEMSYYVPIISNLILKLLIAIYIYIVLNICFSISSLRI
jgi:hypothetical protein